MTERPSNDAGPPPDELLLFEALRRWEVAATPWLGSAAVSGLRQRLEAPHRTAVVGRVGVGKTTLVNRWGGVEWPTGLGGVTAEIRAVSGRGWEVVDTPGIDRPEAAIVVLEPVLRGIDTVVWVVDGLQPLTARERRVMEEVVPMGVELVALIGRGDLLDDEGSDVRHRVETLWGPRLAMPPRVLDLRHGVLPDLPTGPSAVRRREAAELLAGLDEAPSPVPGSLDAALEDAHGRVRRLVEQLVGELHAGRLPQTVDVLLALRGRGPEALRGLLPAPWPLPAPAEVPHGARARAMGALGGWEAAERHLRAHAASWLVEVQVGLAEAYEAHPEWSEQSAARVELQGCTARLRQALGGSEVVQ